MHMHSRLTLCALLAAMSVTGISAANPTPSSPAHAETAAPAPSAPARAADRANAPSAPRTATDADRAGYAAREAASPNAQKYKGGDDVVIIGAGTTALILGIVLGLSVLGLHLSPRPTRARYPSRTMATPISAPGRPPPNRKPIT